MRADRQTKDEGQEKWAGEREEVIEMGKSKGSNESDSVKQWKHSLGSVLRSTAGGSV